MRTPWALKKERAMTETEKCFRRTDPAFGKIYCYCATLHYFFYCTFPCLGQCNADFPSQPTDVLLNCNSWTITLRCLSARVSETGALLHKTVIRARQRFLCGLYVDNMYTVLLLFGIQYWVWKVYCENSENDVFRNNKQHQVLYRKHPCGLLRTD